VRLDIWDTAGQERYRSLAPMYYRGAAVAIVVYDVSSYDSFVGAVKWVHDLKRASRIGRIDDCVVIALVGNKADVAPEARAIPTQEGFRFAREEGIHFYETSAKSGVNVREMFDRICQGLPDSDDLDSYRVSSGGTTIRITPNCPAKTEGGATNRWGRCC
jgi:small GTP-binding protein